MNPPTDFNGLMDEIQKIQAMARERATILPPTDAKTAIQELLNESEPMVQELRKAYPEAIAACDEYKEQCEAKLAKAQENIAKTEEQAAKIKPREEILKSLIPVATALPTGLSLQLGQELQDRYLPAPVASEEDDSQGAAWQDWDVSQA